ncbi:MAG: hypothetical protein U5O39_06035 [Gammaproteobacteria bacterium]|nr:hypothetical protein [Gammaproteobacteria bacterium]
MRQHLELFIGFDTFGENLEAKIMPHRDDCTGNLPILVIGGDIFDERAIDFQCIERKALQVRQRRVPRAEIVNTDTESQKA